MLYKTFCGNEHTKYGIECEPFAKTEFEKLTGFKIQDSGLFIHEQLPYLAASPDGLIDTNDIVEIKCPSSIKHLTPKEAIETGKLKFATLDSQCNLQLKPSDKYYFQVMGQLQITQRLFCYFIIWSPKGIIYQKILKDDNFFETKMKLSLEKFYFEAMLPELIDSRIDRNRHLRD